MRTTKKLLFWAIVPSVILASLVALGTPITGKIVSAWEATFVASPKVVNVRAITTRFVGGRNIFEVAFNNQVNMCGVTDFAVTLDPDVEPMTNLFLGAFMQAKSWGSPVLFVSGLQGAVCVIKSVELYTGSRLF